MPNDNPESGRALELWHLAWCGAGAALRENAALVRARFDAGTTELPAAGRPHAAALATARAAIAHIAAHRRYGGPRFAPGGLRPIQIALVALLEDARVEQLALRARPGLRDLWAPFHRAPAGESVGIEDLLRRLARALFEPARPDPHAWVEKGRRLFIEQAPHWHDPAISRRIGSLLGNDLGQMRVQFNWKTHVTEPAYRDDGSGLWDFPASTAEAPPPEQRGALRPDDDAAVSAERGRGDGRVSAGASGEMALVGAGATVAATLPEWDYRAGAYRPQWVTVREDLAARGDDTALAALLAGRRHEIARLTALLRAAQRQRLRRRGRMAEGDGLDLDACVALQIERRAGLALSARVYTAPVRTPAAPALTLLVDASRSTAAAHGAGPASVLALECAAAALLAEALAAAQAGFALEAFRSAGRGDVRLERIKSFDGSWDDEARARLAGVEAGLSTRLGAALRRSGQQLAGRPEAQRLLFVLSDGEPADIDSHDRRYLIEDARRAVQELRGAGIDTFCFGLDAGAEGDLQYIFGRGRTVLIDRLERLGQHLQALYFRLAC